MGRGEGGGARALLRPPSPERRAPSARPCGAGCAGPCRTRLEQTEQAISNALRDMPALVLAGLVASTAANRQSQQRPPWDLQLLRTGGAQEPL
jgi:hypothetical protein